MNDDEIGEYYNRLEKERKEAWNALQDALKEFPRDQDKIKKLRDAYESACYVGD